MNKPRTQQPPPKNKSQDQDSNQAGGGDLEGDSLIEGKKADSLLTMVCGSKMYLQLISPSLNNNLVYTNKKRNKKQQNTQHDKSIQISLLYMMHKKRKIENSKYTQ